MELVNMKNQECFGKWSLEMNYEKKQTMFDVWVIAAVAQEQMQNTVMICSQKQLCLFFYGLDTQSYIQTDSKKIV
jgi:hypothetical protein